MVLVGMLVKGDEQVRVVARAQHFAGADAHLENRRPTGNGGRNCHEGHDFLFTPSGESRQKTTDGLNAVLRITRDPNDRFGYLRAFGSAARGGGGQAFSTNETN